MLVIVVILIYLWCFFRGLWYIFRSGLVGWLYFKLYCIIICCSFLFKEGDVEVVKLGLLEYLDFGFVMLYV